MMYCRLYSVSMLTCTAACGSTEADNAVLDDDTTRRCVLETAATVPLAGPRAVPALNDNSAVIYFSLPGSVKGLLHGKASFVRR
jgi:hypothetical protein